MKNGVLLFGVVRFVVAGGHNAGRELDRALGRSFAMKVFRGRRDAPVRDCVSYFVEVDGSAGQWHRPRVLRRCDEAL